MSVAVDVLDRADAEALLITRSGDADRIHARALAEELGDLPLALEQACAYIEQTGMSVSAYLELFRRRREELLARGEPTAYDGTVDTTWTLAFERVAHASSAAAELLRICAFLAPDAIPLDLLLEHRDILTAGLDEAIRTEVGFHDAVAELRRYSLVSRDTTGLRIHRLVQAVVRKQLTADERATWARQALRLLEADVPRNPKEPSSFPEWAQLLPHVLAAAQIAAQERVDLAANGRLLRQAGIYLWRRIELSSAQEVLRLALDIFEDIYEPNHPEIAITLTHLGNVLRSSSDLTGARESLERARDIFETTYGSHHRRPEATVTLTSLAGVLLNLGDLTDARESLERAREIFEVTYGPEHHHPEGAIVLGNLGNVLCGLGDLTGARESLERARDIFETAYGSDHPEVARTYGNLGIVLCKLGDLPGARQAQEHARDIFRAVYGPNRPEVANSLAHLSIVLRDLGDLSGAQRNLEQARQIFETSYGPDHPLARWSEDLFGTLRSVTRARIWHCREFQGPIRGARPMILIVVGAHSCGGCTSNSV